MKSKWISKFLEKTPSLSVASPSAHHLWIKKSSKRPMKSLYEKNYKYGIIRGKDQKGHTSKAKPLVPKFSDKFM
jgi:hypothetical protein